MDLYEVMKKRRSFRGYFPGKQVEDDKLQRIAEAVNLAPSACNLQPVKLLLIRNPALRAKAADVYPKAWTWITDAPVLAVMLGNESAAWHRLEGNSAVDLDAAIAMEHFILAATAEGLGTCWVCAFSRPAMNQALGIQDPWSVVAISPLGYAKDNVCRPFTRKNLAETVQVMD